MQRDTPRQLVTIIGPVASLANGDTLDVQVYAGISSRSGSRRRRRPVNA